MEAKHYVINKKIHKHSPWKDYIVHSGKNHCGTQKVSFLLLSVLTCTDHLKWPTKFKIQTILGS